MDEVIKHKKILEDCRLLIKSLNCEILVDDVTELKDHELFDILFQSGEKKKVLLKWILEKIYSAETCTNTSLEDLISIFLPKSQCKNFLIGIMPIQEQYSRWKLIINTLNMKKRRQNVTPEIPEKTEKRLLDGAVLEASSSLWSKKVESSIKKFLLKDEPKNKKSIAELQSELYEVLIELKTFSEDDEVAISPSSDVPSIFEQYQRSCKALYSSLDENLLLMLNRSESTNSAYEFRYDVVKSDAIKNNSKKIELLQKELEFLNVASRRPPKEEPKL